MKMKKKAVIQMIKDEALTKNIPYLSSKIIDNVHMRKPAVEIKREIKFRFSLRFVPAMVVCLVVGIVLVIVFNFNSKHNNQDEVIVNKVSQTYAMQAITLFNFAGNFENNTVRNMRMKRLNQAITINNNHNYDEIASEINKYYLTITDLLNQDNIVFKMKNSDLKEYQYVILIEIDYSSYDESYALYFNEKVEAQNGNKKEININGMICCDDQEYLVVGTNKVKNDESEVELNLYLTDDCYIKVEQEIEKKENEYSYSYYKGDQLVEEYEISVELNNNQKMVELEIFNASNSYEFKFIYNQDYIKCEYELDEINGNVDIYIDEDGNYQYHFDQENIIVIKK